MTWQIPNSTRIAVLLPCYNESITIGKVIDDFKEYLPEADIYVYDNNSEDGTAQIAEKHGAIVRHEHKQGKANVIRSMFREIDADIYVMNDGDDTYPVKDVRKLVEPILNEGYDMVNGDRLSNGTYESENKRNFHRLGNNMVKRLINRIFKAKLQDVMTGYRAFSRSFVKNFPVLCDGFELETELSIFALNNKLKLKEVSIDFQERPEGSVSKLNTFTDGYKVIMTIFNLYRHYKPFSFFGIISLIVFIAGIAVGVPVIIEYIKLNYIFKVPSSILASGLMILSILMFMVGLILDTIAENDRKQFQLHYNSIK